jgi:AhpD family alkylhydroperoxidase
MLMNRSPFTKRIYTWASFKMAVVEVFGHMQDLRQASQAGRVSRQFSEKIMLAVTRVNGCRYCAYGHSRAALIAGVPETELHKIMAGELGSFPEKEAVALAFAQHYAESDCRPDPDAWQKFVDYYGIDTAHDILVYMRMITFGNLYGNTFDALLSRLSGAPAAGSSLWNELGVILGVFLIVPGTMLKRYLSHPPFQSKKPEGILLLVKEKDQ